MNNEPIYDSASEGGVIASLFYKPELILESDFLSPSHFYDTAMGCLYYAIKSCFNKGLTVDSFGILREIDSNLGVKKLYYSSNMPNLDELKALSECVARTSAEDYVELAKSVLANSYKRQLVANLDSVIEDCHDIEKGIDEINTSVYTVVEDLSKKYIIEDDLIDFGDKVDNLWLDIEKARKREILGKVQWKWDILNEYAPLEPTEMYIFGGRRKAGKSVLLMEQAMYLLQKDVPVLYIDTEMSDRLFMARVISNLTGIEVKDVKSGNYTPEQANNISRALEWIKTRKFWHIYRPTYDEMKVYNICRVLRDRYGIEVLIYDYIKNDSDTAETNYNRLGKMTDFLKNSIAGKLNMIVISAVQLNRQNEVADSDKIERYVSFSAKWQVKTREMVERDGIECGNAFMKISANRLGEQHDMSDDTDYFDFCFSGKKMRIQQAKQHQQQENVFA